MAAQGGENSSGDPEAAGGKPPAESCSVAAPSSQFTHGGAPLPPRQRGRSRPRSRPPSGAPISQQPQPWDHLFKDPVGAPDLSLDFTKPDIRDKMKVAIYEVSDSDDLVDTWSKAIVGYIVGLKTSYSPLVSFIKSRWGTSAFDLHMLENGFFVCKFYSEDDLQRVLEGFWTVRGHPMILRRWTPEVRLELDSLQTVPLWVSFHGLPLHLWTRKFIGKICSTLGTPICIDKATAEQRRLAFARACVMVSSDDELPDEVYYDDVDGKTRRIRASYPWRPRRCNSCNSFGHPSGACKQQQKPSPMPPVYRPKQAKPATSTAKQVPPQVIPTSNQFDILSSMEEPDTTTQAPHDGVPASSTVGGASSPPSSRGSQSPARCGATPAGGGANPAHKESQYGQVSNMETHDALGSSSGGNPSHAKQPAIDVHGNSTDGNPSHAAQVAADGPHADARNLAGNLSDGYHGFSKKSMCVSSPKKQDGVGLRTKEGDIIKGRQGVAGPSFTSPGRIRPIIEGLVNLRATPASRNAHGNTQGNTTARQDHPPDDHGSRGRKVMAKDTQANQGKFHTLVAVDELSKEVRQRTTKGLPMWIFPLKTAYADQRLISIGLVSGSGYIFMAS